MDGSSPNPLPPSNEGQPSENQNPPASPPSSQSPPKRPLDPVAFLDKFSPGWDAEPPAPERASRPTSSTPDQAETERRCIEYLATLPPSIQGSNGSAALMRAARVVCWGFDLGESRGFDILWDHFNPRCEPPWSESEMLKKCRDGCDPTRADNPRGWLRDTAAEPVHPAPRSFMFAQPAASPDVSPNSPADSSLGSPPSTPAIPAPSPSFPVSSEPTLPTSFVGVDDADPFRLARGYLVNFTHPHGYTVRYFNDEFCLWEDGAYVTKSDSEIKESVTRFIENDFAITYNRALQNHIRNVERGADEDPPQKRKVTRNIILDTVQALASLVRIPSSNNPPCWLCDGPPASEFISARNGLLHLPQFVSAGHEGAFTQSTPRFFTFNRLDFDFEPDAPTPRLWLKFLSELWPNDPESIACLQDWFGYLITPDVSIQKILLILGPSRGGKGTIGRVIEALVGRLNVTWPTLGRLATDFGAQDLLNKTVAIIADARLSGRSDIAAIIEDLLSISGGDPRTIHRKYKDSVTGNLPIRFVFLSNEFPALNDASAAVLGRFVILHLTESFFGREDASLLDRLKEELPGILLWAIDGWKRIRETKRFTEPGSSSSIRTEAMAVVSPIATFITERCEVGHVDDEAFFTPTIDLYEAWQKWCKSRGREHVECLERFVIRFRPAVPTVHPGHSVRLQKRTIGEFRKNGYAGIRLLSVFESGGGL